MTAAVRVTPHWRVSEVDDPSDQTDVHLLFEPRDGDRVTGLPLADEWTDLHGTVAAEVQERGLSRYRLAVWVEPGRPVEVRLLAGGDGG